MMLNLSTNYLENKRLKQAVLQRNISNAYIFYGPERTGKREEAIKFISEIINYTNCDQQIIKKIRNNNYPDYLFIEPTYLFKGNLINQSEADKETKHKYKPLIRINQIRSINTFLGRVSIEADKKFIVINDAHLLNEASSNCLLKTLEEPSKGIFILITSKIDLILETIISRCQKIKFSYYSSKDLKDKVIKSEYFEEFNNKKYLNLENIIFISNGSPGKLYSYIINLINISENLILDLKKPLDDYEKVFYLAKKIIEEVDLEGQKHLLDYIQICLWRETLDKEIALSLEKIKDNLYSGLNPRLSWEVGLLEIVLNKSS